MEKIYCPRCNRFKTIERFPIFGHICNMCKSRQKGITKQPTGFTIILTDEEIEIRRLQAKIKKPKDWMSLQKDYEDSDIGG